MTVSTPPTDRPIEPRRPRPKPAGRRRHAIAIGLLVLIFGAAGLFCISAATAIGRGALGATEAGNPVIGWLDAPAASRGDPRPFTVRPGDDAGSIGRRLEEAGLVRNGLNFRVLATYYGASASLKAGEYALRPDQRVSEIIDVLRDGGAAGRVIGIPEGWQLGQIRRVLIDGAGLAPADVDAALAHDYAEFDFLAGRAPGATLEGYLFPATYPLDRQPGAIELVRQMLLVFDQQVPAELRRGFETQGLTLHEAVTLASIVEREAVAEEERALIAGVYLNRLRRGMPLQADPTVQFALARVPGPAGSNGQWKAPLTTDDLGIDSPYNTYRTAGLPPGPIASPGRRTLEAVANPTQTEFLYFVARPDGRHVFAKTYEEHLANVERYQS